MKFIQTCCIELFFTSELIRIVSVQDSDVTQRQDNSP